MGPLPSEMAKPLNGSQSKPDEDSVSVDCWEYSYDYANYSFDSLQIQSAFLSLPRRRIYKSYKPLAILPT